MILSFEPRDDPPGLDIIDHVERRQCRLHSKRPLTPREAPVDEFYFPVDRGISITTDQLSLPHFVLAYVRNRDGLMVSEIAEGEARDFPEDLYSVEITAPIKIYVVFEDSFSIKATADDMALSFNGESEILVGARSHHKHPAATITTTSEPHDMMTAVSYLGSALKTTTCERSYPTLRGHPPTIEVGDEQFIPSALEMPKTGIRLELPPDYRSLMVASTLSYYLGAKVEPGEEPRLITDNGFEHSLDDHIRGFEREVERVLKQTFLLDCITRTEGYYPVDLYERNRIEDQVDLNFGSLYDQPLAIQLEKYLSVPYELIESYVPKWKLTAHVMSVVDNIEMIPFLVDDFAVIRSGSNISAKEPAVATSSMDAFMRKGDFKRSKSRSDSESAATPKLIELEEVDSLEQTWIGDGMPIGASKAMVEAFRNRLGREPTDGHIDITVVCNDISMETEGDIVDKVYGSREELPFDVEVFRELSTDDLSSVLQEDTDFFHYIGHIDEEGFECVDGKLDLSTLEYTGIDSFFLNACTSYRQGMHLIRTGAIAGIVTLQDVINSGAERVGKTLAQLLNQGFPLRAALNIAKSRSIMGGHYLVIGDGGVDIAQPNGGIPSECVISTNDDGSFKLAWNTFPNRTKAIGSITRPFINGNKIYYLTSGMTGVFDVDESQLEKFLSYKLQPVTFNGEFFWSDELIDR